jgi:RNA-directed DNA polymerase
VVQTALRNVLEPIFEMGFAAHSYGFRPGRGCQDALRRVEQLLDAGYTFVVDADLKSYFDTIPHAEMRARVVEKIADGRVLQLLDAFLSQEVMSTLGATQPEAGTPQGAVISPLLSNIYLDPLDHLMAAQGWERAEPARDHRATQSDPAGLVRIFPT